VKIKITPYVSAAETDAPQTKTPTIGEPMSDALKKCLEQNTAKAPAAESEANHA